MADHGVHPGPVPAARRGRTTVLPRALHALATQAALEVPGSLRHSSGLGRISGSTFPSVEVRALPDAVDAQVRVALVWPCAAAEVAGRVRDAVARRLAEVAGVPVARVDVHVGAFVPAARARVDAAPSPAPGSVSTVARPPVIRSPARPAAARIRRPSAPTPLPVRRPVAPRGVRR